VIYSISSPSPITQNNVPKSVHENVNTILVFRGYGAITKFTLIFDYNKEEES
jgi:hypothetical protein